MFEFLFFNLLSNRLKTKVISKKNSNLLLDELDLRIWTRARLCVIITGGGGARGGPEGEGGRGGDGGGQSLVSRVLGLRCHGPETGEGSVFI